LWLAAALTLLSALSAATAGAIVNGVADDGAHPNAAERVTATPAARTSSGRRT
jgi:hypothetical protein